MIQEDLRDDPWRLLVAVVMLNKTSAKQVRPVLEKFFEVWPDATHAAEAVPELVANVVKPLGLYNRRAKTLVEMSRAFLGGFEDPKSLPGVGKYGADSFNIFCRGYLILDVEDKELRRYVAWAKERNAGDSRGPVAG